MHPETEGYSLEGHVEGESRHLAAPGIHWELAREAAELRRAEPWKVHGHAAKTLVKYPDLRVVLLAFRRGARLPEHDSVGGISIHTIDGHVRVRLSEHTVDLARGSIVGLNPRVPHSVEAVEDSVVLLTLSFPARTVGTQQRESGGGNDELDEARIAPSRVTPYAKALIRWESEGGRGGPRRRHS